MAQYDVTTSVEGVNHRGVHEELVPIAGPHGMDLSGLCSELTEMPEIKVCHPKGYGLTLHVKTAGVSTEDLNDYVKDLVQLIEPKIHRTQVKARHHDLFERFETHKLFIVRGKKAGSYEVRLGWIPDSVMSRPDRQRLCPEFVGIGPVDHADLSGRNKIVVTLRDNKLESNIRESVCLALAQKTRGRLIKCLMRDEPFERG